MFTGDVIQGKRVVSQLDTNDLEAGKKMGADAGRIALRGGRGEGLLALTHD